MILPDLTLPSRANQTWQYSGWDSPGQCRDVEHFRTYPHAVEYAYNSRGFRDAEWPDTKQQLREAVWCVGDSFTVGIGQPYNHIWPQVLSSRMQQRVINVSMDGASNDWIARRTWDIINAVEPTNLVIMWSYVHRCETSDVDLSDEDRRVFSTKTSTYRDLLRWLQYVAQMQSAKCNIVQAAVPDFVPLDFVDNVIRQPAQQDWQRIKGADWPRCPVSLQEFDQLPAAITQELRTVHKCYHPLRDIFLQHHELQKHLEDIDSVIRVNCLDWARDHHHFDILTAQWMVDQILPLLD